MTRRNTRRKLSKESVLFLLRGYLSVTASPRPKFCSADLGTSLSKFEDHVGPSMQTGGVLVAALFLADLRQGL